MSYRALSNWVVGLCVLLFALGTGVQTLGGKEQMRLVPASGRSDAPPKVDYMSRPYWSALSTWTADYFWTRGPLIAISAGAQYLGFNSARDARVMPGKNGWIFYGDDDHRQIAERKLDLSGDYTEHLTQVLVERREWLNDRGIEYVLIVGPSAQVIYPEHGAFRLRDAGGPTAVEKLIAHLNSASPGIAVAPHNALRAAKTTESALIYQMNDSHWTQVGAAIALNEALKLKGFEPIDWTFKATPPSGGSFGRIMGYPVLRPSATARDESSRPPVSQNGDVYCKPLGRDAERKCELKTQTGRTGRAMLLGDSFGNYMAPAFAESFGETLVLNLWGTAGIPEKRFPVSTIEAFKPDLVVELVAEFRVMPCAKDKMFGCEGRLGTPNPFGSGKPASLAELELVPVGEAVTVTTRLEDTASEASGRTRAAIRLTGLEPSREARVMADVIPPKGFTGRLVGGTPSQPPPGVNPGDLRVDIENADGETRYRVAIAPEKTGTVRFLRIGTETAMSGPISIVATEIAIEIE